MGTGTFFAELRRRTVWRAAALYIGAIWALAQGIAQLGPSFGMPEWGTRWFVIAGAIGFPFWLAIVLLLANTFVWHKGAGLSAEADSVQIPERSIAVLPFANMCDEKPRWLPFLRKLGKAPERLAKIEFKMALPQ